MWEEKYQNQDWCQDLFFRFEQTLSHHFLLFSNASVELSPRHVKPLSCKAVGKTMVSTYLQVWKNVLNSYSPKYQEHWFVRTPRFVYPTHVLVSLDRLSCFGEAGRLDTSHIYQKSAAVFSDIFNCLAWWQLSFFQICNNVTGVLHTSVCTSKSTRTPTCLHLVIFNASHNVAPALLITQIYDKAHPPCQEEKLSMHANAVGWLSLEIHKVLPIITEDSHRVLT